MTSERFYQSTKYYDLTATIASGQTESAAIDLHGTELMGMFIPSTFDGTTLTLQAAPALDGTYVAVQDGFGSDVSFTVAASKYIAISNLTATAGLRFIKLVAGTSQSTTDTVITLSVRSL